MFIPQLKLNDMEAEAMNLFNSYLLVFLKLSMGMIAIATIASFVRGERQLVSLVVFGISAILSYFFKYWLPRFQKSRNNIEKATYVRRRRRKL